MKGLPHRAPSALRGLPAMAGRGAKNDHTFRCGRFRLSKNPCFQAEKTWVLSYEGKKKETREEKRCLFQLQIAIFFRFMAANFSLTQFAARVRPRWYVKRMACFSFASAKTRSMVCFRWAYSCLPRSVFLNCSTSSRYSCQICVVSSFCPFSFAPHSARYEHLRHSSGVLR